jgi:hypothetical protein
MPNQMVNGSFETSGVTWYAPWLFTAAGGTGKGSIAQDVGIDGNVSAKITVTTTDLTAAWHVQLGQGPLQITAGKEVTISFVAKASVSRSISFGVGQNYAPYNTFYYNNGVVLTGTWQLFTYKFIPLTADTNVFLGFNFAQSSGTVWLDNVVFSSK